jgi:PAS domain S-box-containing protein
MKTSVSRPRKRRCRPAPPPRLDSLPLDAEQQASLFELTRVLFAALDADGVVEQCFGPWEDCLHIAPGSLVGKPFLGLVDPRDMAGCRAGLQRTLGGHPPEEILVRVGANGRGPVWLALRPRVNHARTGLHVAARDITAEKLGAESLPAAELVLDEIEEGVLVLDATRPGLPVIHANAGFARLTGFTPAEACNRPMGFLVGPASDTHAFAQAILAARNGERTSTELCFHHKSGKPFWARFALRPVITAGGQVRRIVALHLDISERRLVIDALRAKNEALTEALQSLRETKEAIVQRERMHALGKMASGIVHDFNNLLAPILGFTELMLTVPDLLGDTAKVSTYLQKIRTAATDGAAVVARLREFYRTRHEAEQPADFSVQQAVEETLELTRHRWRNEAQSRGIAIAVETDLASTAPVFGSPAELRQALTNLVLNALDAMPDGGTLRLRTYGVGHWVCIQVADTGAGMTEDVRRRCFEPFFTTKGKSGTGLGLSIVFGTIERHHGRVELQSTEGQGTTFTLWLPAAQANDGHGPAPIPAEIAGAGRALRVLVVDDEDLLLEVVSQHLLSMGHSVDCFTDPKAALECFYRHPHDLVITDRAMPAMTGDQLAKLVREFDASTPVVLLTGFANIIKQNGEDLPCIDEVLTKPVSARTLREVLARHGNAPRARAAS